MGEVVSFPCHARPRPASTAGVEADELAVRRDGAWWIVEGYAPSLGDVFGPFASAEAAGLYIDRLLSGTRPPDGAA